jgi:hypothetical protein
MTMTDGTGWDEVDEDSIPLVPQFDASSTADVQEFSAPSTDVVEFSSAASVDLETTPPLTYDEAKHLTESIRATADVLYVLIQRAHAGKAWLALGYSSFGDYVNEEFDISRSRAYQLLNQANFIQQIESVAPEGTHISLNEASVRDLRDSIESLLPEIQEATRNLSPEDAEAAINELVESRRAELKEEANVGGEGESYGEELAADQQDRDGFSGGGSGGGNYEGGGSNGDVTSSAPVFDPDMEGVESLFGFSDDPKETRVRLESVYDLYGALAALRSMPDFEDIIEWIPQERRVQVASALPIALSWLKRFEDKWNQQPWASELTAPESEDDSEDDSSDSEVTSEDFGAEAGDDGDIFHGFGGDE